MNTKFEELLRKIDNVLQKESSIYLFQHNAVKEFIFPTFTQHHDAT